ncbi:Uncharacterized protein HZ326_11871, partial [Fusarium oxysporum f. sp. albedinis]
MGESSGHRVIYYTCRKRLIEPVPATRSVFTRFVMTRRDSCCGGDTAALKLIRKLKVMLCYVMYIFRPGGQRPRKVSYWSTGRAELNYLQLLSRWTPPRIPAMS